MPLISLSCQSCGANLTVDSNKETAICEFCGKPYVVKDAIVYNYIKNTTNINSENVNIFSQKDFVVKGGVLTEYNGEAVDVLIPNNVIEIGNEVFQNTRIKSVVIPESVEIIGFESFAYTPLKKVTFSEGLTAIGQGAFDGCKNIYEIILPQSCTHIGHRAFSCTRISNMTIPASVEVISPCAFESCYSLKSITVDSNNLYFESSDGILFDRGKKKLIRFPINSDIIDYKIPDTVKEICYSAFGDCKKLESVYIPEGVCIIGNQAFYGCNKLESVYIPEGVCKIGDQAFYGCNKLGKIDYYGEGVPEIGTQAFVGCLISPVLKKSSHNTSNDLQDKAPNKGCYIATCVYGSYDCSEVWTLRRYRDYVLDKSWYGRAFIKMYYAISPQIVKLFGNTFWFKRFWINFLNNIVENLQNKGFENTPYDDKY